jgi:NAD(P)-dependent dehydrogenase (short-subunit alcohol dehydrogenase family)
MTHTPMTHTVKESKPMAASLDGRTAIVTGAGRAVGEAISRELVSRGARVAVVDLDRGAAERVSRALNEARPGAAVALTADASVPAQVKRMTDTAWSALGTVDTLVNCVAVTGRQVAGPGPDDDRSDRVMCTSLTSAFLTTKYVARRMARSGTPGVIIHVDSPPGPFARPVAKSGIYALTRSLALQFGEYGIRVDTVSLNQVGPAFAGAVALMISGQASLVAGRGWLTGEGALTAALPG